MTSVLPTWVTPLLVLAYVILANVALSRRLPELAAAAAALLLILLVSAVRGSRRRLVQVLLVAAGIWLIQAVARGAVPALPLLFPPVVIPAALAWMFGHTLVGDRVALVERFARAVHAPEPLDADHAAYARGVTVMWTWVLVVMTLGNLLLVGCLTPGGLLETMGLAPPFRVTLPVFLWLSNGAYLVIALVFVAEFWVRLRRFPAYPLRNPLEFARRARERLPAVIEALRRE
jgi:hypothetical protein